MGNEFLHVMNRNKSLIREVETTEVAEVQAVNATTETPSLSQVLRDLSKEMERIRTLLTNLQGQRVRATNSLPKPLVCWGCQKEGHVRRMCLMTSTEKGNDYSPWQ